MCLHGIVSASKICGLLNRLRCVGRGPSKTGMDSGQSKQAASPVTPPEPLEPPPPSGNDMAPPRRKHLGLPSRSAVELQRLQELGPQTSAFRGVSWDKSQNTIMSIQACTLFACDVLGDRVSDAKNENPRRPISVLVDESSSRSSSSVCCEGSSI